MAFFEGAGTGAGLIIAIGAQNAFVLAQGIRREHHLAVAALCSICDILLICVGVSGVGTIIASSPTLQKIAALGGAVFLGYYGFCAFQSARRGGVLSADSTNRASFKAVILTGLAVSLLNPHVYLDTVVLLGGISGQFAGKDRLLFAMGASSASICWFFGLSIGGNFLAPYFQKPLAWQILYGIVCLIMWGMAIKLLLWQW